jgi:hypothetical protein
VKASRRAARSLSEGGPEARWGSSVAPQMAHPAANALTRSPQLGQTCGPGFFMAFIGSDAHERRLKALNPGFDMHVTVGRRFDAR